MKKHWRIAWIGLIGVVFGLIAYSAATMPREPEYQGRNLSAWVGDLRNPSPEINTAAELAIQRIGPKAVPCLLGMLRARDSAVKRFCAPLIERQRWIRIRFRNARLIRSRALWGLGALGPAAADAVPAVAELLDDTLESYWAAETLSRIGPAAERALESALKSQRLWVRRNAAGALAALGPGCQRCVPSLIAALNDPSARREAALGLANFPDDAARSVTALIAKLDDPDARCRAEVAEGLGEFGIRSRPAFPKLLKMVESNDPGESSAAVEALVAIDPPGAVAAFAKNLEAADANIRKTAAAALMACHSDRQLAAPALVKCLNDPDAEVRRNAAEALRDIGEDLGDVVSALFAKLNDADPSVRSVAAIALGSFGVKAAAAVPSIVQLIKENEEDLLTTRGLYRALRRIDAERAARALAK